MVASLKTISARNTKLFIECAILTSENKQQHEGEFNNDRPVNKRPASCKKCCFNVSKHA